MDEQMKFDLRFAVWYLAFLVAFCFGAMLARHYLMPNLVDWLIAQIDGR